MTTTTRRPRRLTTALLGLMVLAGLFATPAPPASAAISCGYTALHQSSDFWWIPFYSGYPRHEARGYICDSNNTIITTNIAETNKVVRVGIALGIEGSAWSNGSGTGHSTEWMNFHGKAKATLAVLGVPLPFARCHQFKNTYIADGQGVGYQHQNFAWEGC